MNPGLPGTGIGGLFYILCALLMPFIQMWWELTGNPRAHGKWPLVIRQAALAGLMVVAMTLTFMGLDLLVRELASAVTLSRTSRLIPVIGTSAVLAAVLLSMQLLRLWTSQR